MIFHPDHKNWTSSFIMTAKSIFSRCMYFFNDFFLTAYLFRLKALIPFDPIVPHLYSFRFVEFPSDRESGNSWKICIEFFARFEMRVLGIKFSDNEFLDGFHLSELAVGKLENILFPLHFNSDNNSNYLIKISNSNICIKLSNGVRNLPLGAQNYPGNQAEIKIDQYHF